jgi:hypothetical protein
MKTYSNIDYSFRYASYWTSDNLLYTILLYAKGQRRQLILDYAAGDPMQRVTGLKFSSQPE